MDVPKICKGTRRVWRSAVETALGDAIKRPFSGRSVLILPLRANMEEMPPMITWKPDRGRVSLSLMASSRGRRASMYVKRPYNYPLWMAPVKSDLHPPMWGSLKSRI
jgi:hypothetical protein